MRPLFAVLAVIAFGAIAVAMTAGGNASKSPSQPANPAPRATADPANTTRVERGQRFGSSPGQGRGISPVIRGLRIPVDGAEIPTSPELLPNSPRDYRAGWHEGIDFPADRGTPVRAAAVCLIADTSPVAFGAIALTCRLARSHRGCACADVWHSRAGSSKCFPRQGALCARFERKYYSARSHSRKPRRLTRAGTDGKRGSCTAAGVRA